MGFLDMYKLWIAERGSKGKIYNVGSGRVISAQKILELLVEMADCLVPIEQDPHRLRPVDTPIICCDYSLLFSETGWEPEIPVNQILIDTLNYWRRK